MSLDDDLRKLLSRMTALDLLRAIGTTCGATSNGSSGAANTNATTNVPDIFPAADVQKYYPGFPARTVGDAIRSRVLVASKAGRMNVIRRVDFEAWVASLKRPAKQPPPPADASEAELEERADAAIDAAFARMRPRKAGAR